MLWIRSWRWSADLLIGEWISSVVDQIQERQGEPRRDQERPGEPAQESPGASRTVANLACGRPAVELEWQILAAIGSAAQGCHIGLRTSFGRAGMPDPHRDCQRGAGLPEWRAGVLRSSWNA